MTKKKNTLNNVMMENVRRSKEYQAILTDLAIEGAVPLETAESLLGYEIPDYLRTPSGKSLKREASLPEKKKGKETRASGEADTTQYSGDEGEGLFKGR